MLDVDFVDAFGSLYSCRASIAWLLAITLNRVSKSSKFIVRRISRKGMGSFRSKVDVTISGRQQLTLARAFLQFKQAFRVTDSGALRRLDADELLSASFSPCSRRDSDPVLSVVDWLGLLVDALLPPSVEGRIERKDGKDIVKS